MNIYELFIYTGCVMLLTMIATMLYMDEAHRKELNEIFKHYEN